MKTENPTWSGAGLPPVGVVCEGFPDNTSKYCKCLVAYHDKTAGDGEHKVLALFLKDGKFKQPYWCTDFRPLKTHKQRVIEAAQRATEKTGCVPKKRALEAIYDAGMLIAPEGGEA